MVLRKTSLCHFLYVQIFATPSPPVDLLPESRSGPDTKASEWTPDLPPLGRSGVPDDIPILHLQIGRLASLVGVGEGMQICHLLKSV